MGARAALAGGALAIASLNGCRMYVPVPIEKPARLYTPSVSSYFNKHLPRTLDAVTYTREGTFKGVRTRHIFPGDWGNEREFSSWLVREFPRCLSWREKQGLPSIETSPFAFEYSSIAEELLGDRADNYSHADLRAMARRIEIEYCGTLAPNQISPLDTLTSFIASVNELSVSHPDASTTVYMGPESALTLLRK